MSDAIDLPMVILQKAQHAAEAAAASSKLLETEAGLRLTSIEARMVAVEGRLTSLYAGQGSHTVVLMRIADIQSEHTGRFDGIDQRFGEIDQRFDAIEKTLAAILAKMP